MPDDTAVDKALVALDDEMRQEIDVLQADAARAAAAAQRRKVLAKCAAIVCKAVPVVPLRRMR